MPTAGCGSTLQWSMYMIENLLELLHLRGGDERLVARDNALSCENSPSDTSTIITIRSLHHNLSQKCTGPPAAPSLSWTTRMTKQSSSHRSARSGLPALMYQSSSLLALLHAHPHRQRKDIPYHHALYCITQQRLGQLLQPSLQTHTHNILLTANDASIHMNCCISMSLQEKEAASSLAAEHVARVMNGLQMILTRRISAVVDQCCTSQAESVTNEPRSTKRGVGALMQLTPAPSHEKRTSRERVESMRCSVTMTHANPSICSLYRFGLRIQ